MSRCFLPLSVTALALAATACVNEVGSPKQVLAQKKADATKEGAEQWSSSDAPTLFNTQLTFTLASLPATGEATMIPWAGSYWPTYEDNINTKWDGATSESSPAKYGRAFNVTGVEDAVSSFRGIDSQSNRTKCTAADAATKCKSEIGEQCAIRPGKTEGRCIPTWFGICHAWSPAAIMIPEPKHEVTHNGVTFKVNDLKALASLVHDGVNSKFVSLRCEKDDRPGADEDKDVDLDGNGRPTDAACRDSNAGSFHVLITNYLGLLKQSFVFDRTYDDEVWNQPLRGYRVVETRELTAVDANKLLGVTTVGGTTSTLTANVAQGAWNHFAAVDVTAGTHVNVHMTGSGDGDLFVNFGAQPDASTYACRPYDNGSDETCEMDVPAGATKLFVSVNGYTAANVSIAVNAGGSAPTTYVFNDKAKKLQYLKTDVSYIVESAATTDGNLSSQIDRYTSTDRYEYVLELDTDGKVIGGEWIGQSKTFHPDFAWLPTSVRSTSVAGGKIKYADVKLLLDLSIQDPNGGGGTGAVKHVVENGTVAKNEMKQFGPYKVAVGTNFVVNMTGTGDADLYVRKGAAPTTAAYDCRPYKNGSAESCTIAGPADVFVGVNGYAASSTYALDITYTEAGGGPPPPPPPPATTTHLNVSGDVTQGAFKFFTVNVTAAKPIFVRTTAPKDVDLYLQMGTQPTTSAYVMQAYTSSGNETLRFVPTSSGVLHIGVHGYEASTFTLVTADN